VSRHGTGISWDGLSGAAHPATSVGRRTGGRKITRLDCLERERSSGQGSGMQHRVGLRLSWSIAVFDMVVRYHSLFNIDPSSPPAIDFSTILQKQDDGTEEEMKGALFNKKELNQEHTPRVEPRRY